MFANPAENQWISEQNSCEFLKPQFLYFCIIGKKSVEVEEKKKLR